MELHWSHVNFGKHGAEGEEFPIGDSRTINKILKRVPEEDFECTYFRQRKTRVSNKEKKSDGLFPMAIRYTLPTEFSDGYTDSDSESDNTSNVKRWLESLPANDAWSSVPHYSAYDGTEGREIANEIQDDHKEVPCRDSETCSHGANGSEVKMTGSARQDKSYVMRKWIDNQNNPHEKMNRTLKTRQKIPLCSYAKREADNVTTCEKRLLKGIESEKNNHGTLPNKSYDIPERNIPINEKAVWSNQNILVTTESRTAIEKSSASVDGYDEMMHEMVNRLLTVSACNKNESMSEQIVKKPMKNELFPMKASTVDLTEVCDSKESKETFSMAGIKKARFSTTFVKCSPKQTNARINDDKLSKCKTNASNTMKHQKKNPNQVRKISQKKKSRPTKQKLKSVVKKNRYSVKSGSNVGKMDAEKEEPHTRTVRFLDEVTTRDSSESWRQAAMVKATRNKRILQAVEQIVDDIQNGGLPTTELQSAMELKKCGSWNSSRKRPMRSIENKIIGRKRPIFTNPFVEKCLDKAMDLALSKYKRPQNTWSDLNKQTREHIAPAAYEPPAKKRKPKPLITKLENIQRPDFSLLDSWQSIHNYFLLYSSFE